MSVTRVLPIPRLRRVGLVSILGLGLLHLTTHADQARAAEPAPAVSTKVTTGNVIVVRPDRIDVTVAGGIVTSTRYPAGRLSIGRLARLVNRPNWLKVSGHLVTLRAGVYQAPQSRLVIASPAVQSLRLVGDSSGIGGTMRGSAAGLQIDGVTVTGWDSLGGEPAAQSRTRPYLYYVHGSTVLLKSSTFDHLGRPVSGGRGVSLGSDVAANVNGGVFSNSSSGLVVAGAGAVTVLGSSFTNNAGDGLIIKASTPVELSHLEASSNAGFGVHVRLTRSARVMGVTTRNNADGGISIDDSQQITVTGAVSTAEHVGIVATSGCDQLTVLASRATGDDTAIQVRPGAARVKLLGVTATTSQLSGVDLAGSDVRVMGATVSGAPNGITLDHRADGISVTNSTVRSVSIGVEVRAVAAHVLLSGLQISQAHAVGVLCSSDAITMSGLRISDSGAGVRMNGAVSSATLKSSTMTRAAVGVDVASSVKKFTVLSVAFKQASTAISSSSPDLEVSNGTIAGASIGMHLSGRARVTNEVMSGVEEGFRIGGGAVVHVTRVQLSASAVGFRVAPGAHAVLENSVVSAETLSIGRVHFAGHNVLPAESLGGYGIAAVVAAVCACLLELIRKLRERADDRTWLLPSGVLNTR